MNTVFKNANDKHLINELVLISGEYHALENEMSISFEDKARRKSFIGKKLLQLIDDSSNIFQEQEEI